MAIESLGHRCHSASFQLDSEGHRRRRARNETARISSAGRFVAASIGFQRREPMGQRQSSFGGDVPNCIRGESPCARDPLLLEGASLGCARPAVCLERSRRVHHQFSARSCEGSRGPARSAMQNVVPCPAGSAAPETQSNCRSCRASEPSLRSGIVSAFLKAKLEFRVDQVSFAVRASVGWLKANFRCIGSASFAAVKHRSRRSP